MIQLLLERCGIGVSLQDFGRIGFARIGLPRSGALDLLALETANALVGNARDTVAIEFLIGGATARVAGGRIRLAIAGADCPVSIDGISIGTHVSFVLEQGQRLTIGSPRSGMCALLAVEGGFDVPIELGSRSLYQRGEVGGFLRRTLRDGDVLPILRSASSRNAMKLKPLPLSSTAPIRVTAGSQIDAFSASTVARFLDSEFVVTMESDRMGYRLAGPKIDASHVGRMISDGVPEGAVQIPGSGHPIVLLADHQTTGGYPKIATVITADLRLLAQRRPGDVVRFKMISLAEAREALLSQRSLNEKYLRGIEPLLPDLHTRIGAVAASIGDGCVNATDPETWDWSGARSTAAAA